MKQALARAWHWLGFGLIPEPGPDHARFSYSTALLPVLEGEHSELLRMHGDIGRLATDGRFTEIPAALTAFKSKFDLHVLNENLNFYNYVEEKAAADPEERNLIRAIRREMNVIAHGIVHFTRKYRSAGVQPGSVRDFLVELHQVGKLLVARIEREEHELYELYRP